MIRFNGHNHRREVPGSATDNRWDEHLVCPGADAIVTATLRTDGWLTVGTCPGCGADLMEIED